MIGAVIGDIVGSVYEGSLRKPSDFPLFQSRSCFTDDSVLTIAVAKALLLCKKDNSFSKSSTYYLNCIREEGRKYPHAGYGERFYNWLFARHPAPYNSYGNGSAMRVSPVGLACRTLREVLSEAKKCAEITHNHPDGIKGAQAAAGAVFLAGQGEGKEEICRFIEKKIGYELDFDIEKLHTFYKFEIQCAYSVPQAIFAFLKSRNFEDTLRKAVYIGGDTDTTCCIAGAIAGAYYKNIEPKLKQKALSYLHREQQTIIKTFNKTFRVTT